VSLSGQSLSLALIHPLTGVCFFEMLALKLPFDGDTTVALVKSILQDQPDLSIVASNNYSPEILVPLEGLSPIRHPLLFISHPLAHSSLLSQDSS
jgi:hypothetical protein